jgi:hypothetical protein
LIARGGRRGFWSKMQGVKQKGQKGQKGQKEALSALFAFISSPKNRLSDCQKGWQ